MEESAYVRRAHQRLPDFLWWAVERYYLVKHFAKSGHIAKDTPIQLLN